MDDKGEGLYLCKYTTNNYQTARPFTALDRSRSTKTYKTRFHCDKFALIQNIDLKTLSRLNTHSSLLACATQLHITQQNSGRTSRLKPSQEVHVSRTI